jgi:hypothetical protein
MFTSTGTLLYDPGKGLKKFDPWWALLLCDNEIARYYALQLKKQGIEVFSNDKGLWKTHISVMKGETPPNPEAWTKYDSMEVEFYYSHVIRSENGEHAWVDVYSEDLANIRQELGFGFKPWFHLTIGRLVRPHRHSLDSSQDFTHVEL